MFISSYKPKTTLPLKFRGVYFIEQLQGKPSPHYLSQLNDSLKKFKKLDGSGKKANAYIDTRDNRVFVATGADQTSFETIADIIPCKIKFNPRARQLGIELQPPKLIAPPILPPPLPSPNHPSFPIAQQAHANYQQEQTDYTSKVQRNATNAYTMLDTLIGKAVSPPFKLNFFA